MKSHKEMTNAVLSRAKAKKAAQKRRCRKWIVTAICVCCFGMAVLVGTRINQNTNDRENKSSRLSVFCITANAATQQETMLKDEKIPYCAVIHVWDITGLEALELVELQRADIEYVKQMAGSKPDDFPGGPDIFSASCIEGKTMISTIFAGTFYLSVDDYKQVKDVSVTTTEIGWTATFGMNYYDPSLRDGIGIIWTLSNDGTKRILKNPEMKLSELKDTITIMVEFKDGTKESAVVDITVDDDGWIYGTFRGTNFVS